MGFLNALIPTGPSLAHVLDYQATTIDYYCLPSYHSQDLVRYCSTQLLLIILKRTFGVPHGGIQRHISSEVREALQILKHTQAS